MEAYKIWRVKEELRALEWRSRLVTHLSDKTYFASLGWDLTVIGLHYGELSTVGNTATGDPKLCPQIKLIHNSQIEWYLCRPWVMMLWACQIQVCLSKSLSSSQQQIELHMWLLQSWCLSSIMSYWRSFIHSEVLILLSPYTLRQIHSGTFVYHLPWWDS